jgi:hypothetical protein
MKFNIECVPAFISGGQNANGVWIAIFPCSSHIPEFILVCQPPNLSFEISKTDTFRFNQSNMREFNSENIVPWTFLAN